MISKSVLAVLNRILTVLTVKHVVPFLFTLRVLSVKIPLLFLFTPGRRHVVRPRVSDQLAEVLVQVPSYDVLLSAQCRPASMPLESTVTGKAPSLRGSEVIWPPLILAGRGRRS